MRIKTLADIVGLSDLYLHEDSDLGLGILMRNVIGWRRVRPCSGGTGRLQTLHDAVNECPPDPFALVRRENAEREKGDVRSGIVGTRIGTFPAGVCTIPNARL